MKHPYYFEMLDLGHSAKYADYLTKDHLSKVMDYHITDTPTFASYEYTIGPEDGFCQDFFFDKFGYDLSSDQIDMLTELAQSLDNDDHLVITVKGGL